MGIATVKVDARVAETRSIVRIDRIALNRKEHSVSHTLFRVTDWKSLARQNSLFRGIGVRLVKVHETLSETRRNHNEPSPCDKILLLLSRCRDRYLFPEELE